MRRVVVVGAGFFGALVARRLWGEGVSALVVSRRGEDLRIDAEDRASVAAVLRRGDVVVDTAGPFQQRSTVLVEVALERGCDVIDLSDSLSFARRVLALGDRVAAAGVSVLTSCSAIAAVAAACVSASGLRAPESCDLFLAPATAQTANPATIRSFVASLGARETRAFPLDARRGMAVESAAPLLLHESWPSLRHVGFWVDPNLPLDGVVRAVLGRWGAAELLGALAAVAAPIARALGPRSGQFAVAVRERDRELVARFASDDGSYLIAAEPAVMAAAALARGAAFAPGLVPVSAQVEAAALFDRLRDLGITITLRAS